MSSTNKTTNYELSQFIGTDKPAWLADYNQDMSKIDAQMKLNADAATGADGKADANTTNIGDLTYLSTSAKNNLVAAINEVNSTANNAYNVASNASQTANTANTNVSNLAAKFNLTNFSDHTCTKTGSGSFRQDFDKLKVAKNSDGSVCKIYGFVQLNNPSNVSEVKIAQTGLAPTSDITIAGAGLARMLKDGTGGVVSTEDYWKPVDLVIKTNGDVILGLPASSTSYYSNGSFMWWYPPTLLFVKSFGDTPTPED